MTPTHINHLRRPLVLLVVLAAVAVPATAAAHPVGAFTQKASPAFVPAAEGPSQSVTPSTVGLGPVAPVQDTSPAVNVEDGAFDWPDGLVGAGVATAAIMLGAAGALTIRRQGRLGYR
jgi:hypothetical protein